MKNDSLLKVLIAITLFFFSAYASVGATIPPSVGSSSINVTPPPLADGKLRFVNSYELTLTGLRPNTSGGYTLSDDCGIDGTHWKIECSLEIFSTTTVGNERLTISGKFIHKTAPHPRKQKELENNESRDFNAVFLTAFFNPSTSVNVPLLNELNVHEAGIHRDRFLITSIVGVGGENFFGAKKFNRVKLTYQGIHPVPLPATLPMLLAAVLGIGVLKRGRFTKSKEPTNTSDRTWASVS